VETSPDAPLHGEIVWPSHANTLPLSSGLRRSTTSSRRAAAKSGVNSLPTGTPPWNGAEETGVDRSRMQADADRPGIAPRQLEISGAVAMSREVQAVTAWIGSQALSGTE
jgi:hypothetical protein